MGHVPEAARYLTSLGAIVGYKRTISHRPAAARPGGFGTIFSRRLRSAISLPPISVARELISCFGPSEEDYAAVKNYVLTNGFAHHRPTNDQPVAAKGRERVVRGRWSDVSPPPPTLHHPTRTAIFFGRMPSRPWMLPYPWLMCRA